MAHSHRLLVGVLLLVLLAGCTAVGPSDDTAAPENLGVVDGVAYDERLDADNQPTINDDAIDDVVARMMARIERERGLAFESTPEVEVLTREAFRDGDVDFTGDTDEFDALRWQATHIVGADEDLDAALAAVYGGSVAGFYDSSDDGRVVLIVEDEDSFVLPRATLVHELVHALQDQQLTLRSATDTTDAELAWQGLIEGEADLLPDKYEQQCASGAWTCVPAGAGGSGDRSYNQGLFASIFVPYGEGPSFVAELRDRGGWDAVNDAYENPPQSTAELISPDRYPFEPTAVEVEDRSSVDWGPITDNGERATDTIGPGLLYAMFWYNDVIPESHFRSDDGISGVTYEHPLVTGWTGDQFVGYESVGAESDQAYVYRSTWTNATEAERFAEGYRELLDRHGAEQSSAPNTHVVDDGGFAGAYRIDERGDSVTVVYSPSAAALSEVHVDHQSTTTAASMKGSETVSGTATLTTGLLAPVRTPGSTQILPSMVGERSG